MKRNPLGASGLEVSELALGAMNFGCDWHGIGAIDDRTASSLVDMALERGVNLIDTADIYGRGVSEECLGRILGPRRQRLLIATKVLGRMVPEDPSTEGLSARWIARALDDSLRRLRTDRVDLYMPHAWDPQVPIEETLEALDRAVRAGKVRAAGCSNFSAEQLARAHALSASSGLAPLAFDQVQYSLAWRHPERDLLPSCREKGVGLMAWSPLAGGFLSGKYGPGIKAKGRRSDPAKAFPLVDEARMSPLVGALSAAARLDGTTPTRLALGWVCARPGVSCAVVGARTLAQLEESLGAAPPSPRAAALLDRVSALCGGLDG